MSRSKLASYLELLRFSNVLTTVADVWMGLAVTLGGFAAPAVTASLTLASVGLYLSGMVLNDVFGAAEDARARSQRPLPSGRISRRTAAIFGGGLMLLGLAAAGVASALASSLVTVAIAIGLALVILLYDALPKATPAKPWLMGACRGLNVLLGMSLAGAPLPLLGAEPLGQRAMMIPLGMLAYIAGVTLFARSEAERSSRAALARGALLAMSGIALLATTPLLLPPPGGGPELRVTLLAWGLLWVVALLLIARRFVAALLQPSPRVVQSAVGNAIQGVIVIDAALAWGYAGQFCGLAILALLPPTMLLARRIAQT